MKDYIQLFTFSFDCNWHSTGLCFFNGDFGTMCCFDVLFQRKLADACDVANAAFKVNLLFLMHFFMLSQSRIGSKFFVAFFAFELQKITDKVNEFSLLKNQLYTTINYYNLPQL